MLLTLGVLFAVVVVSLWVNAIGEGLDTVHENRDEPLWFALNHPQER